MIEIPDVPHQRDCASCASRLSWLYSPKTGAWICVVPIDDVTFRLHPCRHAQDRSTWRVLPHGSPPTPEYRAFRAALAGTDPAPEETT